MPRLVVFVFVVITLLLDELGGLEKDKMLLVGGVFGVGLLRSLRLLHSKHHVSTGTSRTKLVMVLPSRASIKLWVNPTIIVPILNVSARLVAVIHTPDKPIVCILVIVFIFIGIVVVICKGRLFDDLILRLLLLELEKLGLCDWALVSQEITLIFGGTGTKQ